MAVLILGAGVAGALVIVSNGDGPSRGNTATPTSGLLAPTIPSDPQATIKGAVMDAYRKSYEGFVAVGKERTPDSNDPRLTNYSTGTALIAKQRALADNSSKGQVFVGDVELHPTVIELGPDTATVVDCSIDRTALVDARTGSTVVGPGPNEGVAATAKLQLEGGTWKVSSYKDEKRSCVPPAA